MDMLTVAAYILWRDSFVKNKKVSLLEFIEMLIIEMAEYPEEENVNNKVVTEVAEVLVTPKKSHKKIKKIDWTANIEFQHTHALTDSQKRCVVCRANTCLKCLDCEDTPLCQSINKSDNQKNCFSLFHRNRAKYINL